jgi:hypothetical protein
VQIRRTGNANAAIRHQINTTIGARDEAMAPIGTEIDFVVLVGNGQSLRQLARSRAELTGIVDASPFPH